MSFSSESNLSSLCVLLMDLDNIGFHVGYLFEPFANVYVLLTLELKLERMRCKLETVVWVQNLICSWGILLQCNEFLL